jgi:type VII secretion integral membrane protein EccD
MRTATSAVAVPGDGGTDVCRLTIDGPNGRADLAVPVSTPVSALMPVLVRRVVADPDGRGGPWVLQRLGEDPLDPDGTPETLGLRHGDVLHLRPSDGPMAALDFDDVSDGVAEAIGRRPDRWRPELTRRLLLGLSCLVLAVLAAEVLGAGPGMFTAACCGVIAIGLATGCVVASLVGDRGSALVTGLGGCGFAALAGLTAGRGTHGGFAPGASGLLLAATCTGVLAAILLLIGRLPLAVPGTVLVTAAATGIGSCLSALLGWDAVRSATVVALVMFVLGQVGPRLVLRMARLRAPQLPRNAEELQQDIEPEPEERVVPRVTAANAYLNTLAVSSALVYAVAFCLLARQPQWIGWVLTVVFCGAVLLRARRLTGTWQRIPTAVAGTLGLGVVLLLRTTEAGPLARGMTLLGLLAVVALLLIGAAWMPVNRPLPLWGHIGDVLETVTAIALLPLALQLLHVYAYFRSLAG